MINSDFSMSEVKIKDEQRIPFEICVDPFYSEENRMRLQRAVEDVSAGRKLTEHELITDEEQRCGLHYRDR